MEVKIGTKFLNTLDDECEIVELYYIGDTKYLGGKNKKVENVFNMSLEYFLNKVEDGHYKIIPEQEKPWYPDDSGEWVEVPDDLMEMPKELHPEDEIETLRLDERESKDYVYNVYSASSWKWNSDFGVAKRVVAYKIVKKYKPVSVVEIPEKNSSPNNKYDREILPGVWVDVYDVLDAWKVTNPALQHLIKKALQAGDRGHKDREEDLQDIIDSAIRAKEIG